jgi:hypothetical protein
MDFIDHVRGFFQGSFVAFYNRLSFFGLYMEVFVYYDKY